VTKIDIGWGFKVRKPAPVFRLVVCVVADFYLIFVDDVTFLEKTHVENTRIQESRV
jgi:hypothetical protein